MGTLYYGDNLPILRDYIKDESVDLVYLDPPFKSDANYNAFFQGKSGASASQIKAFEDTWHWVNKDNESMSEFQKMLGDARTPDAVRKLLQAYHDFLGGSDMMAYLMMMSPRLVELKRVLKPTGSLYLHCDPTASHYLKLLLDAVFEKENFANEIIWQRTTTKNDYKQGAVNWPRIHDVILMYHSSTVEARKQKRFTQVFEPYDEEHIKTFYNFVDPNGRHYRLSDLTAPGQGTRGHPQYEFLGVTRYWRYNKEKMEKLQKEGRIEFRPNGKVPRLKVYLDDAPGVALGDVWTDIRGMFNFGNEMLGYPTQKPIALLERILQASSNPGDLVLDPFCGCGTTIDAAEKHDRKWIGIDITQIAMTTIKKRLWDTYHEVKTVRFSRGSDAPEKTGETKSGANELVVRIIGEPATSEDAAAMAKEDPYGFQWWAAGLVGGQGAEEKKKGADGGIDGRIIFYDDPKSATGEEIILQVKGGNLKADDVRSLGFVAQREKAAMGVLISVDEPTDKMYADAAAAGYYAHKLTGKKYPKLQLRSVKELMEGKGIERPSEHAARDETFKKAPKSKKKQHEQKALEL
jgi:DNA modification methylase